MVRSALGVLVGGDRFADGCLLWGAIVSQPT